ncbi:MAG: SPOR domain-containing protein [Gemmatimonadales bacterium]
MNAVRRSGGLAVGIAAALLTAGPADRLTAQSDPRLQEAIRLAQAGRQDSGIALVNRLLAALPPADSLYAEALYTAGILSFNPRTITTHLQRVVVEYGRSAWADDALLRLTQFYFAQDDAASTVQTAERLRRDYPDSPLRPRAAFPAARAYFTLHDETQGCALIREALDGAGEDVEFKNQVSFYAARCAAVPPPAPAASLPAPPPPVPTDSTRPAGPASAAPTYAVQVLAVKQVSQVDEMLTRLKVMGFDARVVRDTSGLFKVRVGRYPTREEAQRAQARLKTRLGGQPFVVEEP